MRVEVVRLEESSQEVADFILRTCWLEPSCMASPNSERRLGNIVQLCPAQRVHQQFLLHEGLMEGHALMEAAQ